MNVRDARPDDAEAIARLASEFHEHLHSLGDRTSFYFTAQTYLRDGFGESPTFLGLVAESDGSVIGYLIFHLGYDTDRSRRLVYIVDLYVEEAVRGRGVGKALMQRAAEKAQLYGAEALWWGVYDRNELALRFYENLGANYIKDIRFMSIDVKALTAVGKGASGNRIQVTKQSSSAPPLPDPQHSS